MAKYHRYPEDVEAFRYWVDEQPVWFQDRVSNQAPKCYSTYCDVYTKHGVERALVGDWIVRSSTGEITVLKPDEFKSLYERVLPNG